MGRRSEGDCDADASFWFLENSTELFVVIEGGKVTRVNPAFCKVTGWSPQEVIGKTMWELTPKSEIPILEAAAQAMKLHGAYASEHRILKKDGRHIHVRSQAKLVKPGIIAGLMQDITEERRRQRAAEQAERSAELLRTSAGISVWRYRPDDDVFIFDNHGSAEVDGAHSQGRKVVQGRIHPEDNQALRDAWRSTVQTGELSIFEYRRHNDGDAPDADWRRVRTAWRGSRPMASGRWEVFGITQDITELANARDAALRGEEAAKAAAETKAQFLANMSHEIRTPMNGVLGVLHLLKNEPLSDEGRKLLGEALACGSMLAELLNDVIDFSKIEAGKLELAPEPVDVAAALEGVAALLKSQAQDKGLWLRTAVSPQVGWVQADPVRLRQMLFNLLGNAVKFTLNGGVEARMSVRGEGAAQRLRVEIEDTGIGISREACGRLFERFNQADNSTTREFGGAGLGLSICRAMAEMMSGEIGVDSTPGMGSTFWFEIAAPACAAASSAGESDGRWLEGLSVLVVDDNATNRIVAGKMLENLGAAVTTEVNGALGVEAAKAGGYDLIFMDIQMPVMDGMEATRTLRALNGPVAQTPIIAMTANAMAHQRRAYMAAGMNGMVPKPLSPHTLMAELARLMGEDDAAEGPAQALSA